MIARAENPANPGAAALQASAGTQALATRAGPIPLFAWCPRPLPRRWGWPRSPRNPVNAGFHRVL